MPETCTEWDMWRCSKCGAGWIHNHDDPMAITDPERGEPDI